MRAMMSGAEPAAEGNTQRTGRDGQLCALAQGLTEAAPPAAASDAKVLRAVRRPAPRSGLAASA